MNFNRNIVAVPAIALALYGSTGCTEQNPSPECTYVAGDNKEIPDPAFWAITEENGSQLITPESELAQRIELRLGSAATDSQINPGDILIASEDSYVVSAQALGIDPEVIKHCRPGDYLGTDSAPHNPTL